MSHIVAAAVFLLLVCRFSSAQLPGGCTPDPPSSLITGPNKETDNVPTINAAGTSFNLQIGGYVTGTWTAYSATQVQQHGLWCQANVVPSSSDIGDWYYPTSTGLALVNNTEDDPYLSLKCTNQIGLVVDGDVTNYQGIVRCNTTVPGLATNANYMAVYTDNVFDSYSGPTVEPNMILSVLSSRDADPSVMISFSFNVSFGPPSSIRCIHGNDTLIFVSGTNDPSLSRKVIRSKYISDSQPDMTRVVVMLASQLREERTYTCTVEIEGRVNIGSGVYDTVQLGSANTTTTVTVAGTPIAVTASRNGWNSILVSWTAPSPEPHGYEVFYETASAGVSSRLSGGNTSNTELTLTGLTLGETYTMFVVSFGAEGEPVLPSPHSNLANESISAELPELSDNLSLTPTTSSVMASWTPPEFSPDSYNVTYSCQLLCDTEPSTSSYNIVDGTASAHTILNLEPGSNCTVSLAGVFGNSIGNTINSSIDTKSERPGAPEGLVNTSVETRSLSVVWDPVACSEQGGPIIGYRVRYGSGRNIFTVIISEEGSKENAELTELTPFTSYFVQVAAVNDAGIGEYTDREFTVTTLQEIPGPVSDLSASPEVVQLTISWGLPAEPNGVIIAYEVYSNSSGVFSYTNTSATWLTLRDLSPNTIVAYSVRAYTIIGPGSSVTNQASTGSTSPSVNGVSAVALSMTSVRVSWTPVNLTVVESYTVHYASASGDGGTVSFPASASSGEVSGLMERQQYNFSVTTTLNVNGELYQGLPDFTQSSVNVSESVETTLTPTSRNTVAPPDILAPLIAGWVLFGVAVAVVVVVAVSAIGFLAWKKAPVKVSPSAPTSPTKIAVV